MRMSPSPPEVKSGEGGCVCSQAPMARHDWVKWWEWIWKGVIPVARALSDLGRLVLVARQLRGAGMW